jgi:hypothetical protein
VMTNGTSFATDATEEAQLVFELVLEVIKELRKTNAAEDREALSMPIAVSSFAPTAPAPNANVHEEEDDGQTSAAGDTRGSPGGSETPTTSMNYETLEHFMEREHVQEEESAMATNDGFILPAAVSPSRRRSPRGSPPARRQRVHSPRAEVAAAVAGVLQRDDADEAGEEAREIIRKAMLLLDGEYNQIKMSMEEGGFGAQCRQDDVLLMKLAASCSKTQQPNDVMKAFAILHAFFCSEKFRHLKVTNMRRPAYMDQISSITREVPPASRALFHKYFMILDAIAGDAFKPSIIIKGWTAAGVNPPPDVDRILRNCPRIEDRLTRQQYDEVLGHVYSLAREGLQALEFAEEMSGTMTDAQMEYYMEPYFGSAKDQLRGNRKVNDTTDLAFGRWRCALMNTDGPLEEMKRRATEREQAEDDKQERLRVAAELRQARLDGRNTLCACSQIFGCKARERASDLDTPEGMAALGWGRCTVGNCKKPFCPHHQQVLDMHIAQSHPARAGGR